MLKIYGFANNSHTHTAARQLIPAMARVGLFLCAVAALLLLLVSGTQADDEVSDATYYCEGRPLPGTVGCVYCYCSQPDACEYELRAEGSSCWIRDSRGSCSEQGVCVPNEPPPPPDVAFPQAACLLSGECFPDPETEEDVQYYIPDRPSWPTLPSFYWDESLPNIMPRNYFPSMWSGESREITMSIIITIGQDETRTRHDLVALDNAAEEEAKEEEVYKPCTSADYFTVAVVSTVAGMAMGAVFTAVVMAYGVILVSCANKQQQQQHTYAMPIAV